MKEIIPQSMSSNPYYPRWITLPDGINKRVVQNNIEHGNVLGKKFNEQAEEIAETPVVPDAPVIPATVEPKTDPPTPEPVPVIPATPDHPAVFKGEDGKLRIGNRPSLKPPVK